MTKNYEISDELFNHAKAVLGEQQLVDLIAVSGTYVTIAMLLSTSLMAMMMSLMAMMASLMVT
jgi:hypothetical protein